MDDRWRALAVLTAARASLGFQFQSVASLSTDLMPGLGLSFGALGVLIGLYFLPGIVVALPAGALSRRLGDKRLVMFGLVLMTFGAVVCTLSGDSTTLAVGRVIAGVGGVTLNVVMSKMVIDWFTGREVVLAMAIFVNSFPIGVGLAMLTLGVFSALAGWQAAMGAVAVITSVALLAVWALCKPHPNDAQMAGAKALTAAALHGSELFLVCLAGAIWGIFNGCFSVLFGFAPSLLVGNGSTSATTAGIFVGVATWCVAGSVQIGGLLGQRWIKPSTLMTTGTVAWSLCLLALAFWDSAGAAAVVLAGIVMGLPAGTIMAMPASVLRPESRAVGMGYFYLWLYVGHGALPPVAGWLRDATGQPEAPIVFAAGMVLSMLVLYRLFLYGVDRRPAVTASVRTG
jgi:predicted MFS family arabinose efflux permease